VTKSVSDFDVDSDSDCFVLMTTVYTLSLSCFSITSTLISCGVLGGANLKVNKHRSFFTSRHGKKVM